MLLSGGMASTAGGWGSRGGSWELTPLNTWPGAEEMAKWSRSKVGELARSAGVAFPGEPGGLWP